VPSSGTWWASRRAYARRGVKLELGERLALGYQFHIASSREQAIREAAPHYEENMKIFRRIALGAGIDRRADRGDARPAAGRHRQIADDRGRGEGRAASSPADRRTSSRC